jgi:hypothetical protein
MRAIERGRESIDMAMSIDSRPLSPPTVREPTVYTALRTLAAILVGMLLAFVVVVAVEFFGGVVHPLPGDFGGTTEEMCRHVEAYQSWVLAVVVPAWAFAAFVGTWAAKRIGNVYSFTIVGLLLLAGLVLNLSMLPYPLWFKIACLVAIPAAVVIGGRVATRSKSAGIESK